MSKQEPVDRRRRRGGLAIENACLAQRARGAGRGGSKNARRTGDRRERAPRRASTCAASPGRRWTAWPARCATVASPRAMPPPRPGTRASCRVSSKPPVSKALLLVLDGAGPAQPGACLRSAAGAGVTAVVIPKDKSVGVNATVRKTSAGAADRIPVVQVTNLRAACARPAAARRLDLRPGG